MHSACRCAGWGALEAGNTTLGCLMRSLLFFREEKDKDWYKKYFRLLAPKLVVVGAYSAHNTASPEANGIGQFMDYVSALPNLTTRVDFGIGQFDISEWYAQTYCHYAIGRPAPCFGSYKYYIH